MTEQEKNTEGQNIHESLWAKVSSLLEQKPDFVQFPPDRVVIPDSLQERRAELLNTCFDGGNDPSEDWKEVFLQLFEVNPNNIHLWMRYGNAMVGNNYPRAIRCWERALEIDPNRPGLLVSFGYLYAQYGQNQEGQSRESKWETAKSYLRRAMDLNPELYSAWHRLGVFFENEMLLDERINSSHAYYCYMETLKINPDYVPSLIKLGWLLARIGKIDEAVARLRKAIKLDPDCLKSNEYITSITPFIFSNPERIEEVQRQL